MLNKGHKVSIIMLKYAPIIGALVMWLHVTMLLCDINFCFAEYTFGVTFFPWLVCFVWSKTFGFCEMHRAFLTYTMLVSYCVNIQEDIGFGNILFYARLTMFIIGLILMIWFIVRYKKYKYHCFKTKN